MQIPSRKTDIDICLVKYAHGLASIGENLLSSESFDRDGHEEALRTSGSCRFESEDFDRLRLDILTLICDVACKFHSVRKNVIHPPGTSQCSDRLCHSCSDTDSDNISVSSTSTSLSHDSDSTFHVTFEDDEIDTSDDMYNHQPCDDDDDDDPHKTKPHPQQDSSSDGFVDADDVTDDEDESSVEEMYSDFNEDERSNYDPHASEGDDYEADNLICPGDVIEYCTINDLESVRRSSVHTIVDNKTNSFITLTSGHILRPKEHSVRKIKMYCSSSSILIPNPLSKWHSLDKCILQAGTIHTLNENNNGSGEIDDWERRQSQTRDDRRRQNRQR